MTEEKKPFWTSRKKRVARVMLAIALLAFMAKYALPTLRYLSTGPDLLSMWRISPLIALGFLLAAGFIRQKKWRWASFSLILPALALAAVEYYSSDREIPVRNLENQRARALATDRVVQNVTKFDPVYDDREDEDEEIDLVELEQAVDHYAGRSQKINQIFDYGVRKALRLPLPSVELYVRGNQVGWKSFDYEYGNGRRGFLTAFQGDALWVRAVGEIYSDSSYSERTEPDGIVIDPTGEHKYKVRLNENLPYRALLVRFCADNSEASCGAERFAGSEALVCAADQDLGRIEFGVNEFVGTRVHNLDGTWESSPDLTFPEHRKSGYSISISENGAAAACAARQDKATVVARHPLAANIITQ